jgi:hypothetical protein
MTPHPSRFTTRKEPRCLLNMRLGGPQSRSGRFWRTGNLLPQPRFDQRILLQSVTVAVVTTQSGLSFLVGKKKSDGIDLPLHKPVRRIVAVSGRLRDQYGEKRLIAYLIWRHMDTIGMPVD